MSRIYSTNKLISSTMKLNQESKDKRIIEEVHGKKPSVTSDQLTYSPS